MHTGWVAAIGENRRNVAMAMSLQVGLHSSDQHHSEKTFYYFDAVTGELLPPPLLFDGNQLIPVDINGDGYSEFIIRGGDYPEKVNEGDIIDRNGKLLGHLEGKIMTFGKLIPGMYGQQIMMSENENGIVRIYADEAAVPGPSDRYPEYHENMQHMMASGYNEINANYGI